MIRACLGAAGLLVVAGCFYKNKGFQDVNPNIPGSRFKTIATLSGTDNGSDIRLTMQLRSELNEKGWRAVPRSGRWDNIAEAVSQICAPGADEPVDGVLLVTYNHLALYDCQTIKAAFEIQSSPEGGGMGLPDMKKRLLQYLSGKPEG